MSRIARLFGVLLIALAITGGFAQSSVRAADDQAEAPAAENEVEVNVHVRECPPGAQDVFEECHPNGVPGVKLTLALTDESVAVDQTTDADGNAQFIGFTGDWTLAAELPADWIVLSVYCSYEEDLGTETYIDLTPGYISAVGGDVIYCDVYLLDTSAKKDDGGKTDDGGKKDDDGGTEMPDTGIGAVTGAGSLFPLIASGAAAAGLAFGTRRRKA